jgi:hypothetical protein
MGNVQRKGLETPLLRCFGVVCAAKAYTRASLRPVNIGVVGDVEGGGSGNVVGSTGGGLSEVVCSEWGGGRGCNRGITGVKKERVGKRAQTTKMVHGEGDEGYMLGVQGRNDVITL